MLFGRLSSHTSHFLPTSLFFCDLDKRPKTHRAEDEPLFNRLSGSLFLSLPFEVTANKMNSTTAYEVGVVAVLSWWLCCCGWHLGTWCLYIPLL